LLVDKVFREKLDKNNTGPLLKIIDSNEVAKRLKGSYGRTRSVHTSKFRGKTELVEELICSHKIALRTYEVCTKLKGKRAFHGRLFGALQNRIYVSLKICKRMSGVIVIR